MPYLEKLDENDDLSIEQKRVYNFALDTNLMIKGAAGSGKTILALMRAKQLEDNGKSVLFIVFNNVLSSFTKMARETYGLNKTKVYQMQDMTEKTLGFRVYDPEDLSDDQRSTLTAAYNFDHVIIDEGQDFSISMYKNFFSKMGSKFTICCDTKQSVYNVDFDENILSVIFPGLEEKNLEFTYRNPQQIMKLTYHFYYEMFQEEAMGVDITCYNEQSGKVIRFSTNNEIDMVKNIIDNRGINTVGILLPRGEIVSLFVSRLKEKGCNNIETYWSGKNRDEPDNPSFRNENPKLMPYWSAKGIQFDTVIIPFLDRSYEAHTKNDLFNRSWEKEWKALFVAMTRARKNLFLIRTNNFIFPYELYLDDDLIEERGQTHSSRRYKITYKNDPVKPSPPIDDDDLPF
tara:strand:+ start:142 stop:1347 length:1206 start_codon:yes stop_codon:yes gene_type:complete